MRPTGDAEAALEQLRWFFKRRSAVLRALDAEEVRLILAAKDARLSWEAIASIYGVSHQALRQRFARLEQSASRTTAQRSTGRAATAPLPEL